MQTAMIQVEGRLVSLSSAEGKERMKWERPGYNPNAPENQFPKMLYRAQRRSDGVASVNEVNDVHFGGRHNENTMAAAWNRQCQCVVGSPEKTYEQNMVELQSKLEQGWRPTQLEALARLQAHEEAVSTQAAHRHHDDRHLSEKAQAEAAEADAASPEHLPEIPRKRGRRRSAAAA